LKSDAKLLHYESIRAEQIHLEEKFLNQSKQLRAKYEREIEEKLQLINALYTETISELERAWSDGTSQLKSKVHPMVVYISIFCSCTCSKHPHL